MDMSFLSTTLPLGVAQLCAPKVHGIEKRKTVIKGDLQRKNFVFILQLESFPKYTFPELMVKLINRLINKLMLFFSR